jgi:chromosome segregation ATPase
MCTQAICSACRVSAHSGHEVIEIRLIFEDLRARIVITTSELEDVALVYQVDGEQKELTYLRDVIHQRLSDAEGRVAEADMTISDKKSLMRDLRVERQEVQEKITMLVMKQADITHKLRQLDKDVDKLQNEKTKIVVDMKERFAKSSKNVQQCIRIVDNRITEIKSKIVEGRAAISGKIILDADNLPNLATIYQQLKELIRVSRESDMKVLIEDVRKSIGEFGIPDAGRGLQAEGNKEIQVCY